MLQGVTERAQKCQAVSAPVSFIWCQCEIAGMSPQKRTKGRVNMTTQKCHIIRALPTIYRGLLCLRRNAITSPPSTGATIHAQQCRVQPAPTSFIWCQPSIAEMPLYERTKGRVRDCSQKCHTTYTLPNQLNGVIVKTQKCRDIVAPRERPTHKRSNAETKAPLPTNHRGSLYSRRNAIGSPPPPNLGHYPAAETPSVRRPITRGQYKHAEMPIPLRLAT